MIEYLDGLAWAAVHVCGLKCPAGQNAHYYLSGSILMIGSLLALMVAEGNR
jgi:hypothetical protein